MTRARKVKTAIASVASVVRRRRSASAVLRANEDAAALLAEQRFRWCRARLLAALAGAAAQGVLAEVLAELVDDDGSVHEGLVEALRSQGWLVEAGTP